jgi:hypothetical protein
MDKESYQKALEEHREQLKAMQADMKAKTQVFFKEGCKLLFEAHPELESFSWQQYTDYFNDGDTCRFHVHCYSESISLNGQYYEDWVQSQKEAGKTEDEAWALLGAVSDFLSEFEDETMKAIFGDHVEITVSRDKTEPQVSPYTRHD